MVVVLLIMLVMVPFTVLRLLHRLLQGLLLRLLRRPRGICSGRRREAVQPEVLLGSLRGAARSVRAPLLRCSGLLALQLAGLMLPLSVLKQPDGAVAGPGHEQPGLLQAACAGTAAIVRGGSGCATLAALQRWRVRVPRLAACVLSAPCAVFCKAGGPR